MSKQDAILLETFGGRIMGGRLSQLATYSDLFFKMSDAILLVHLEKLTILECNPATAKLLGANEDDVLGTKITDWMPITDDKDVTVTRNGKEMILEISTCPLKLSDYLEVLQVIVKDVTEVHRARVALEKLSTTDEMTGLRNYRSFKEQLAKVHEHSAAKSKPYSVVFMDVDHFKKFNDRNGHPAGDAVLRKFGELLRKVTRAQDLPARYGGEEFVLLLPDTDKSAAEKIAQKFLDSVRNEVFPYGAFQPLGLVTASLGVSSYPQDGNSSEQILKNADNAVYASKEQGRNRVTAFSADNVVAIKKAA